MTIELNDLLVVLLYEFLVILVIVLIVLGIKLIKTLKKVDVMIDDININMSKLDGVFDIIDVTSDYAESISSKILGILSNALNVFTNKKGKDING